MEVYEHTQTKGVVRYPDCTFQPRKIPGAVHAFRIKSVAQAGDGKYLIELDDRVGGDLSIEVDAKVINEYGPLVGEMFIQEIATGAQSIMFASAFEKNYMLVQE